jgi:hypothetical protein
MVSFAVALKAIKQLVQFEIADLLLMPKDGDFLNKK